MITRAYFAALVLLVALILSALLYGWMPVPTFKAELVKVSLQVLVFGIAAGLVKYVLDRAAEVRNFRSEVLRRLGDAHRSVYRIRRVLKAAGSQEHNRLLGELMDARQDLSGISHDIRVRGLLDTRRRIKEEIDVMRAYLEDVIDGAISEDGTKNAEFRRFLDVSDRNEEYETHFKEPYIRAKRLTDPSFHWLSERKNIPGAKNRNAP